MNYPFLTKRTVLAILVIGWCAIIFNLSAQNSDESTETSGGVIEAVCEFVVPEFDDFTGHERTQFIDKLQFAVRKCAHFTAYAVLGVLIWCALYGLRKGYRYALAVGFSFLYACSDEIHQYFVPGRSCEFRDVLIDTSGAATGALAALSITALALHFRQKSKKGSA